MTGLADRVLAGDRAALARLIRQVDDRIAGYEGALRALYRRPSRATTIGVTGAPGAGKSTLTDRLIQAYREQGRTVAVLAVDPSSPFTGGAILGDRIRMNRHALDEGVFIRSLATRGHLGGLSRSAADAACVLGAAGYDVVVIETVGVGQDEVDVARWARTTVVVTQPGAGDHVQALKAGVMEVADVFAVNKADRPGADLAAREIEAMLRMAVGTERAWEPPVIRTVGNSGEGVDALVEAISRHGEHLARSGEGAARLESRSREAVLGVLRDRVEQRILGQRSAALDDAAVRVLRAESDPYTEAEALLASLGLAEPVATGGRGPIIPGAEVAKGEGER